MRQAFSRAAATYDDAAVLARETGRRLADRLSYTRLAPQRVADLGCATGDGARALGAMYPSAGVLAIDFSLPMLQAVTARVPWLQRLRQRGPMPLQADARGLPLADASLDLIWSNLMLHWLDDPRPALAEAARVLRPGGLLTFAVLGPDTLREWRAAVAAVDPNFSPGGAAVWFRDMHDWGDMLVAAGFGDPVMDRDDIILTYARPRQVLADQRRLGVREPMFGSVQRRLARCAFAAWPRDAAGRLPLTFEVVFGQAWRSPARPAASPTSVIRFHPSASGHRK